MGMLASGDSNQGRQVMKIQPVIVRFDVVKLAKANSR
jgi:hypothetical protein